MVSDTPYLNNGAPQHCTPRAISVFWNISFLSPLSAIVAGILTGVCAHIDEDGRGRPDPMITGSSTGIEIEGIGQRLAWDGHVELDDKH